jgi:glycosyltransferase involved in cell wall biosynthesis
MLVEAGHQVDWWTSTFNHSTKELRATSTTTFRASTNYNIHMLHGGGYRRYVSLARVRDHRRIAKEFAVLARAAVRPDAIIASLPSLELCEEAVRYGRANDVPTVVDVRDLWPDVFEDAFPAAIRPLASVALEPLRRVAQAACAGATAIWGHAPAFVDWGLAHAGRERRRFDCAFPFGYAVTQPTDEDISNANTFWSSLGVSTEFDGITACFIGSIGHQTDVMGIVEAAKVLGSYPHVRFVICGDGDRLPYVRGEAAGLGNLLLPGWQRRAAIWTLLRRADIGIAAYIRRADFIATIPNKVPEYLSGGLAVALNLSSGLTHDLLVEHSCGFSYHDDPRELASQLRQLHENRLVLRNMQESARSLFTSRFRADAVYGEVIATLEQLIAVDLESKRSGSRER